jgi:hypothetical protein
MINWPALLQHARDNLHMQTPVALYASNNEHSRCFRVLLEYMKSLNTVPILHNFAATVFHLSLLLKVCGTLHQWLSSLHIPISSG